MSTRSRHSLIIGLLASFACSSSPDPPQSPHLGEPLTEEQAAVSSFTVMSDGRGLPPGSGDALRGERVYAEHCVACHGVGGRNGINDQLVGGHGSLATNAPVRTVGSYWPYATTLFDYIRRAMPYRTPAALSSDDVYAVTAYLLYMNGIIDETVTLDATVLPKIEMPNVDNFEWAVTP